MLAAGAGQSPFRPALFHCNRAAAGSFVINRTYNKHEGLHFLIFLSKSGALFSGTDRAAHSQDNRQGSIPDATLDYWRDCGYDYHNCGDRISAPHLEAAKTWLMNLTGDDHLVREFGNPNSKSPHF